MHFVLWYLKPEQHGLTLRLTKDDLVVKCTSDVFGCCILHSDLHGNTLRLPEDNLNIECTFSDDASCCLIISIWAGRRHTAPGLERIGSKTHVSHFRMLQFSLWSWVTHKHAYALRLAEDALVVRSTKASEYMHTLSRQLRGLPRRWSGSLRRLRWRL